MAQPLAIAQKSFLVFFRCCSSVSQHSLALFIGVLLLSKSVAATPTKFSPLLDPPPCPLIPRGGPEFPLKKGEAKGYYTSCSTGGWGGSSSITQQPAVTSEDATRAAAQRALQEGLQLFKQRTAESKRQAIAKWEEALVLYRVVGDKKGEAVTLLSIGRVYSDLGQKQKALDYYNQSLPLSRATEDKAGEAVTLNNIGLVYDDLGQTQKALEYYNQSLLLNRATGDKAREATTLNNIGLVYDHLGQKQKALDYYNQSLPLTRATGDKAGEATTLNNIGAVYSALGEKQKALDYFNQSLPLKRATGDKAGEAVTLNNIGAVYSALGEKQKALEFYNQSLPLKRVTGDKAGEATTLNNIGLVYSDLGQKQKALEYYNQSLPLTRATGDKAGEATTLSNIGGVYDHLGQKQKALDYYNQSLPIFQATGDKVGEAVTLSSIGGVYSDLGQKQKALEFYNQSLPLTRATGDKTGEARTLNNIGLVYSDLGQKQKALDYFNQSLPLTRTTGNKAGEATTLSNIGGVYDHLGQKQRALEYYNQSLPIFQATGDKAGEALTLSNIGLVYSDLGEKQKALDYYNQSLPLRRATGDKAGEAVTLNNIGGVYDDLGEQQKALEYYNQSLPLRRATGDRAGEATTLSNIGAVYDHLGQKQKALGYYNQSLPLTQATGDKAGEARTLNNIGLVYSALGEKQKALDYYNQSLPLTRATGHKTGEAIILNNIGGVYSDLGEQQKALEYYNQSLPLTRATGDKAGEATTLYNLAYLERNRGNLNVALTQMEAAITIIEDLRTKIDNKQLRTSYFASKQHYYEFYIDLLMQLHKTNPSKGYDALALNASERARSRSLLELLTEAQANIRQGADPKLLEQENTLQQKFDALEKRRIDLFSGQWTNRQVQALEQERKALQQEYQQVQEQIRRTSPRYASLKYPQPLTLSEIQQQVLDDDTLLLEYSLGEERSYLWAVTKTSFTSYELPKRADIEALAQSFYQNTGKQKVPEQRGLGAIPREDSREVTTKLSQILLSPVAEQLAGKRLLIVSDGALQYLPFAALPTPDSLGKDKTPVPLIVQHEIVNSPSASTIAILRQDTNGRKLAPKTVAVIADPVFSKDDERIKTSVGATTGGLPLQSANPNDLDSLALTRSATEAGISFQRLPFTRKEGDRILSLVPSTQSQSAFDLAANRTTATSPELSQYQIVHFATHGILNSQNPELSGVVLSLVDETGTPQNGFLRLNDIFNLNLPAELVTLSACETGLGQEIKGEGLVGLTRGFMYAGSPRVLVSLWSVADRGTSELMSRFYKKMLQENLQPVAALRAAQIEMLQNPQWQDPYYWAAFTLQGEWR